MIVNDRENQKTMDTETGVYLHLRESRPNESLKFFDLHIGAQVVKFSTEITTQQITDGPNIKIYNVYRIDHGIKTNPELLVAKAHIERLLPIFKNYYGDNPGLPAIYSVTFCPSIFAQFQEGK
jgi:hypothetical protein